MKINHKEVHDMYKKTEKLPGLDLYVNIHFSELSLEDQAKYVTAATSYMSELEKIVGRIKDNGYQSVMCHNIVFDSTEVFDPLEHKFLKEYPLFVTNYIYGPIPSSWLGLRIRELNKYIQIYIPDPHGSMSEDEAIEKAVDDVQEYIEERMRIRNEWENIRKSFG